MTEAEEAVVSTKREFEEISVRLRRELERFDVGKVIDFQNTVVAFVEAAMTTSHQVVKVYEAFLPEAKAIGAQ